ncbi:alpha/beta hydrolase [Vagococcus entomophilus]|uniref:BD-FAE-like domain-containing protein n=1 Tax=Vagococcus entomophilus TaxID=1160095 RepID=A0A430AHC9_9ENTE|nr:alpha/beta hydrolase [Vagococcus entomophilus]RSU07187.1 hypothetical protein CBF30_08010 [Vagococcus entomophilus]
MKYAKRILMALILGIFAIVLGVIVMVNVSPKPFVHWLARTPQLTETPPSPKNIQIYTSQVTQLKNLTYPSKYKENKLDIYLPKKETSKKYPVILWVHGGAFITGDKKGLKDWGSMMASQGYIVVAMNYEVAPAAHYPAPVIQTSEVYAYLKKNAHHYPNMDLDKLIVGGDSAGAQIAGQFIAVQTNKSLADEMKMKQVVPKDTIKASLLYCGPYDIKYLTNVEGRLNRFFIGQLGWAYIGQKNWQQTQAARNASVSQQVTAGYPPTFLTDGNSGSFEKHAKRLEKNLKEKQVPVTTLFFDGKKQISHEYQFKLRTTEAKECFSQTKTFLEKYVK